MRTRRQGASAPAIDLPIGPDGDRTPLYTRLYRVLREHILSGSLAPGAALPSARTMAADLRLSRNTVESALTQLRAEGFVVRRVGAGTVVANPRHAAPFFRRPATPRGVSPAAPSGATPPAVPDAALSARGAALVAGGQAEIDGERRLGPCTVGVDHFPLRTWQRLLARATREHGTALLQTADPQGDPALRRAICEHTRLTRGVDCTADQVLIVGSTQQALDLAGRLLLATGDTVLVEEPGYASARAAFVAAGARVHGVPVDEHGIASDQLSRYPGARLLYLTPSHQFPLGVTLALPRRLAALEWARSTGAWIVEDDYDSEFRYRGRPIMALQGFDRGARVLYAGTFNKVLFPGIRLAWLILPPALVQPFTAARRLVDGGSPPVIQSALAEFLRGGHFAAHLRRARRIYAARHDLLVAALSAQAASGLRIGATETGLHLVVHFGAAVDDVAVARAVQRPGIGVSPLSRYHADTLPAPRGLLIFFGAASDEAIRQTAAAIGAALRQPP